jgi:hypothetical protein
LWCSLSMLCASVADERETVSTYQHQLLLIVFCLDIIFSYIMNLIVQAPWYDQPEWLECFPTSVIQLTTWIVSTIVGAVVPRVSWQGASVIPWACQSSGDMARSCCHSSGIVMERKCQSSVVMTQGAAAIPWESWQGTMSFLLGSHGKELL